MCKPGRWPCNWLTWNRFSGGLFLLVMAASGMADGFPMLAIRAWLGAVAGALALCGAWLMAGKRVTAGGLTLLASAVASAPLVRAWWEHRQQEPGLHAMGQGIAIAQMNVFQANHRFAEVMAAARATQADVIAFQEVDAHWLQVLKPGLSDSYPYHWYGQAEEHYGIAMFSRTPLGNPSVFDLEGLPAIRAEVAMGTATLLVVAVHLRAPESAAKTAQRNRQWRALERQLAAAGTESCLLGDLNTVPWDEAFRHFSGTTGLTGGYGVVVPTWPAGLGMAIIPLDHVLTSKGVVLRDRRTFSIPGSDHRGVTARVVRCNGAMAVE